MKPNVEGNVWKDIKFWEKQIKNAGVFEKLPFFNDATIQNNAPHSDPSWGEPVVKDVILDGKKADIYHSDNIKNCTFHRLYIHIKE